MGLRAGHGREPELGCFGDPPVTVADGTKLAGEAELAEAGKRMTGRRGQRDPSRGTRDRERDGEVRARLIDPDAPDDIDEYVGRAESDSGMTSEHGEHEGQPVAVQAGDNPAGRFELGRRHQRYRRKSSAVHNRNRPMAARIGPAANWRNS